ncbi:Conserved_hypothetical protein [Hexamita inflata]|uniref:Uncharacterized protein n=1 Tax=Hexamita inflata TaxID=28002 RepID=A0AA86QN18_9EUKA|nr:Conserved hypothetical protein [Hexamita inflata]
MLIPQILFQIIATLEAQNQPFQCNKSILVGSELTYYCVSGNQITKVVNNQIAFVPEQQQLSGVKFMAAVFFKAQKISNVQFTGFTTPNSQISHLSIVFQNSQINIRSSNISFTRIQQQQASLIYKSQNLVLFNSVFSLEMQTEAVSGVIQTSQNINVARCFYNYSVVTESGSVICQQFQRIKLALFSINGSFQSQSPMYLVQDSDASDWIELDQVASSFYIQRICKNNFCSINGSLKTGPETPKYDKTQLLIGNQAVDKQITVAGAVIGINCVIDGNYDYNATYVVLNENIAASRQRLSLFCFKPMLSKIDVLGEYSTTNTQQSLFYNSLFYSAPSAQVSLDQCRVNITIRSSQQLNFSLFLDQDQNVMLLNNCSITIAIDGGNIVQFNGISESLQSVVVRNSSFNFTNSDQIQQFNGIANKCQNAEINVLQLFLSITAVCSCGISYETSGAVSINNAQLSGSLSGENTFGVIYAAKNTVNLNNITYQLVTHGKVQNCGFVQIVELNNAVQTNNITFKGFSQNPGVLRIYDMSTSCPCMLNSQLINGLCYCIPDSTQIQNVCQCPIHSAPANNLCVCQIDQTQLIGGICTCTTLNAYISDELTCKCPLNATNGTDNICSCPDGSNLVANQCACQTLNAFPYPSGCRCASGALNSSNSCQCPVGTNLQGDQCVCSTPQSSLVNGVCECDVLYAFMQNSVCVCGQYATNKNNQCTCPSDMKMVNKNCVCITSNAVINAGVCICPSYSVNNSLSCVCPSNSVVVGTVCQCTVQGAIVTNDCNCPTHAQVLGNICTCPANSVISSGACACTIAHQVMQNSQCVCPTGQCGTRVQYQQRYYNCPSGITYQTGGCCSESSSISACNCTATAWVNVGSCTPSTQTIGVTKRYQQVNGLASCSQMSSCRGTIDGAQCYCASVQCNALVFDTCQTVQYNQFWANLNGQCLCQ